MQREWNVYHNTPYDEQELILAESAMRAHASLNPAIQKGILRLVSPLIEQAVRIEVQPDRSDHTEDDLVFVQDLDNWNTMMEEADGEAETLKTIVLHNLVGGTAITKTYYGPRTRIVRSEAVHPLSFAVDGEASRVDLSDAMVVCQKYYYDEPYLRRHYDWVPRTDAERHRRSDKRFGAPTHRLDELWIRREMLEECDEDVDLSALEDTKKQIFRAVLIDDEVVSIKATPFWWPDFPYSVWRNFTSVGQDRRAMDFFGFSYGTLLLPQQKFLDEMLATLVAISRNMPTGQVVVTEGTLDREQQANLDGQVIELESTKNIGEDFQQIPPIQVSPHFANMVTYITQVMQEMMPSLSEVFTGESPSAGSSGRAINSLQWAAFTQLSDNLRAFNEMRKHRMRQRLTLIQQTAKKPISPHIWRGGLDLPDYFPSEARYVGFELAMPDAASMPQSPAAKLQIIQTFAAMGYIMPIEDMLKITGFDKGYGLTAEMFQQMPMVPPGQGGAAATPMMPGVDRMSGAEAPLP